MNGAAGSGVRVSELEVASSTRRIVAPLDLQVAPGETLAIIGESGSGKSLTARAITGLLPRGIRATGRVAMDGFDYDVAAASADTWRQVRGRRAVLLLQDPFTSLSPVMRCGRQIALTVEARLRAERVAPDRERLRAEVERRLAEVQLPPRVARQYPSELSGGMRQRVAVAAALAAEPELLIADEPTTALDASTQGEVLDLLRSLQETRSMSLILISHDLGVVEGRADGILVMRDGEVVERGEIERVIRDPQHEYTRALIAANPSLGDATPPRSLSAAPVLTATGISKSFGATSALTNADIDVAPGEVLAIVGESGSGKSTLARSIAGLEIPDSGEVTLRGRPLPPGRRGRRPDEIQIVFQDPYSTLNPSFTIGQTLEEAVRAGSRRDRTAAELLELVELDPGFAARRPSQLSGGQRQRVAIARALAPNPEVLICDESVSALDVSVQAQILALLTRLRDELELAILFITHDLGVVGRIADRVVVMRGGEIVERGATERVLRDPQHDYTRMLVAAARHDSMRAPDDPRHPEGLR